MRVIEELRTMGYHFKVVGDNIKYKYTGGKDPDPAKTGPLFQELKARKSEALAYLRLEEETRKALKQLKEKGYVKIWSEKIDKEVYIVPDAKTRASLPIEAVAFTFSEIRELTARRASPEELEAAYDRKDLSIPPEPIPRSKEA